MNTATSNAAGAAPKKRGDGNFAILFVDKDGKESKRASGNTASIRIADKSGAKGDFAISKLKPDVLMALAALGIQKRIDVYVRNTQKLAGGDAVPLASKVFESLVAGEVYSRKEGGGAAAAVSKFDFDLWREVMAATVFEKTKKEASEKQLDLYTAKLKGMTPQERRKFTNNLMQDKIVAKHKMSVELKRLKGSKSDSEVNALDLF